MKRRTRNATLTACVIAATLVVGATASLTISGAGSSSTPTPVMYSLNRLPILTNPAPPIPTDGLPPTPVKINDLAPQVAERDKAMVVFQHPDGTREWIWVRSEDVDKVVRGFAPGDTLKNIIPPASARKGMPVPITPPAANPASSPQGPASGLEIPPPPR